MKTILTIAGTDPDGGAGVQADLKTCIARGVYGTSVITAVVAQNTVGVQDILVMPATFVKKQIDSVMRDISPRVWKTGMLGSEAIVKTVAERANFYNIKKLVIDPVMQAKTGRELLEKSARKALMTKLLPLAYVLTPNIDEAEALTGRRIHSIKDMQEAVVLFYKMGAKNVVVKGGHLVGNKAVDMLFDGSKFTPFSALRIKTKNTHGTGCTFATAIAAELAKGKSVIESVRIAKQYVTEAIRAGKSLKIGKGNGPIDHNV